MPPHATFFLCPSTHLSSVKNSIQLQKNILLHIFIMAESRAGGTVILTVPSAAKEELIDLKNGLQAINEDSPCPSSKTASAHSDLGSLDYIYDDSNNDSNSDLSNDPSKELLSIWKKPPAN